MAHIYLRHPIHGTKIATMDLEAEADEQNGWMRFDPDAPVAAEIVDTPVNTLETKRRRRQVDVSVKEDA